MPKRVTSWRGHLHVIAAVSDTALFKEMSQGKRAVGDAVSDLTLPRFKLTPQLDKTLGRTAQTLKACRAAEAL